MIIQNSHFKKKVSLGEQKAQKEDRFQRGRQIAFTISDYFRVTGAHDTVFDYAELFSVTLRDDNVQEFDSRWDDVLLSMSKIPSDDVLEGLYKLRIRESEQLKIVLEVYDMGFIKRYRRQIIKNWKRWWKEIRNSDCETLTPDTGKSKQEQWSRVERAQVALDEEKVCVTSGKKKANVRRETSAVSCMRMIFARKNQFFLVFPSVSKFFAVFLRFPPRKKSFQNGKKRRQECCGYCDNCTTIGLRLARLGSMGFSKRETVPRRPKAESFGINSTGTIHSLRYVKQVSEKIKNHRFGKIQSQNSSSSKSLRYEIWGQNSRRYWKTRAMAPAARYGILPEIFTSSKKRTKLHSIHQPKSGSCRPHPP